ncbi:MAG: IgGFc-binding protein [Myxococcota bacterium]|nr:IgGFc-binding protein [Myxococcota bacterium]
MQRGVTSFWHALCGMFLLAVSYSGCSSSVTSTGAQSDSDLGLPMAPPVAMGCFNENGQYLPVNTTRCLSNVESVCNSMGMWQPTGNPQGCISGPPPESCEAVAAKKSYIGCEYWPVDLDNAQEVHPTKPHPLNLCADAGPDYRKVDDLMVCTGGSDIPGVCPARAANGGIIGCPEISGTCSAGRECPGDYVCNPSSTCVLDAQRSNFTVVVSNPSTAYPTSVTLTHPGGQSQVQMVEPGGVARFEPAKQQWPEASIDGSGKVRAAYRLQSTLPIIAYQFNPLDNEGVFSNDGSLLLPSHALGSDYVATITPTLGSGRFPLQPYHGYVTIVATQPGLTTVEVIPTANVRAGGVVPAIAAASRQSFQLSQGEVLSLEAIDDGDLTGTQIFSPTGQSFAAFAGHEAAIISDQTPVACCADHLEEQLFPTNIWGKTFIVARSEPRRLVDAVTMQPTTPVPDRIRILTTSEATNISFVPARPNHPCTNLSAFQVCDMDVDDHMAIISNRPIQVAHLLLSAGGVEGDPALAFLPPVSQYRGDYAFLIPSEYDRQFVSVVTEVNTGVTLDGVDMTASFMPVGGEFFVARLPVTPGSHTLKCPDRCGLMAYGFSNAVSYYFAAGLDLEPRGDVP